MSERPASSSAEFDNFQNLTRRLLAVPKSEVPKHVPKKPAKLAAKKLMEK